MIMMNILTKNTHKTHSTAFFEKLFARHQILFGLSMFVGIPLLICAAMFAVIAPFAFIASIIC